MDVSHKWFESSHHLVNIALHNKQNRLPHGVFNCYFQRRVLEQKEETADVGSGFQPSKSLAFLGINSLFKVSTSVFAMYNSSLRPEPK
jgi:hypothetical protein